MPHSTELRELPKRVGPRGKRYVYHTHEGAWGCIYDRDADLEAIAMVNETRYKGLTRRIVNRLNAGTI